MSNYEKPAPLFFDVANYWEEWEKTDTKKSGAARDKVAELFPTSKQHSLVTNTVCLILDDLCLRKTGLF